MRKEPFNLFQQSRLLLGGILSLFIVTLFLIAKPGKAAPLTQDEYEMPYEIPDGVWFGAFSGSDSIALGGNFAEAFFNGTMDFTVIAGDLHGSFEANGSSSSEGSEGYGIATFSASGELGGTAKEPWMLTHSSAFDYVIEVQGMQTNFQMSMDSGFSAADLILTETANCSSMSGNFDSSVIQSLEDASAKVLGVQTEFTITRFADISTNSSDTYKNKLTDLMIDADKLISETLKNQALDADLLFEVLMKADGLNSGIYYDTTCTYGVGSNKFNTAIVGIIAKLINLAYDHPEWFTSAQINQIAYAAFSTGAIGAGSPNEALALDLTDKLEDMATAKLEDALKNSNPDCGEIYIIYTVAEIIWTESLLNKTTSAMTQFQCKGL